MEIVIPIRKFVWKIDEDHMNGGDIHMNGNRFNIQIIGCQVEKVETKPKLEKPKGKVISLVDFRNNRKIKEIPKEIA